MTLLQSGIAKPSSGYDIDQSLRFNNPDGAYLTFTPSSTATSTKIFTFSGWVKRGQVDQERRIFTAGEAGSTPRTDFTFGSTGALSIGVNPAGSAWYMATTTALYRDPSAWYHIVWSMDTSQATPANRSALYINGEQVTDFSSNTLNDSTAIPQDSTVLIGQSGMLQAVGGYANNLAQSAYDGYLAEVHFIDGQKLTPASFGETNSKTNQWVPIEVTGMTYGTNGFYQKYSTPYGIEAFTTTGSHTWTCPAGVTSVEVLTVAGGGSGGGKYYAGGGGAGGVVHATDYAVTPGVVYDITVGAGGATRSASHVGNDGSNSVFNVNAEGSGITLTATGGGGGGSSDASNGDGRDGGSGGGGAMMASSRQGGSTTQNTYSGTANVTGYGYDGGDGYDTSNNYPAGGGGGAGAVGASSSSSGAGGIGRQFTTFAAYGTDSSNAASTGSNGGYFAGGGGGAGYNNAPQPGGTGGGGTSARGDTGVVATAGLANTGGGGGGASHNTTSEGAAGGSGVVLISVDAGIGADSSGNGNNFSATNLVATDQVLDSPTNNFATLNPIANGKDSFAGGGTVTFSEGNLKNHNTVGAAYWPATMELPTTGKWYWECYGDTQYGQYGLQMSGLERDLAAGSKQYLWGGSGIEYPKGTVVDGTTYTSSDILGFAVNLDDGEIKFYKNNSLVYTGTNMNTLGYDYLRPCFYHTDNTTVYVNFGQDSSFAGTKSSPAGSDFYYAPPTSFKALCSKNLPDPAIALPTDHFNTVLYTGNSGSNQSVTGVGFQPDFLWMKPRDYTDNHGLIDSVRGGNYALYSNSTSAEDDNTGGNDAVTLDSDGFTVNRFSNSWNRNGYLFVGWNWKAGGSASTNDDGTIDSEVSANPTAGFSIATYTGNALAATIGHGLSQAPELVIVKNRTTVFNWLVGGPPINPDAYWQYALMLSSTAAAVDETAYFGYQTAATATTFPLGNSVGTNDSGDDYVAYCWHSVDGYSKVGSYVGNGVVDGPFIYTGFRPVYVMCKVSSTTGADWRIIDGVRDPYNYVDNQLWANDSSSESNAGYQEFGDLLSNGFKVRSTNAGWNYSGQTLIYLAFAESPFKTSNAR